MKVGYLVLLSLIFILCAGFIAQKPTAMFTSFEEFNRGPEDGVDLVWSTKKIYDEASLKTILSKYDSLIIGQIWVVVDKDTASDLNDKQLLEISRHVAKEIKNKFGLWFKLVDIPTENTLRLSSVLTNIEKPKPFFAQPGGSLPVSPEIPTVSKIVANKDSTVGRARLELFFSDANTKEPLIATIDKYVDDKGVSTIVASQDATKEALSWWIERFWTTLVYWNWIQARVEKG